MALQKAALVTGASHGIGSELAIQLASEGWKVFGTGRDLDSLLKTQSDHANFQAIQADFTRNADLEKVAAIIEDSKLPLMLNVQNAGMKSPPRNLDRYNCAAIDEVMAVNLLAPMKLTAMLVKCMPAQSRILYVTSRAATLRLPESTTYCASKAGLDEVSAIVRKELADRQIGVLSVIPGEVDTEIQRVLRETQSFHLKDAFIQIKAQNQLIQPRICATFLKWLLCEFPFSEFSRAESPVSIYDSEHHRHWLKNANDLPAFPF